MLCGVQGWGVAWQAARVFVLQIASSFDGGWRGPMWQTTLLVLDQKILDWLRLCFQETEIAETAIRSGIKSRFGSMGC